MGFPLPQEGLVIWGSWRASLGIEGLGSLLPEERSWPRAEIRIVPLMGAARDTEVPLPSAQT